MFKREMDMCSGPILSKMLVFAVPLMLSGVLQLLFNAADLIVVGRFAGSQALAAVGATGAMINLIINLFMGLSVGVNVLVSQNYGAGDNVSVSRASHCAVLVSVVGGALVGLIGVIFTRPLMELMGTPEDVMEGAVAYMKIYFAGLPVIGLYNFGSAVLRSAGDTVRPLIFLFIAGVINVFLNLFFVIVCHMAADGVALATVISQAVSAILVLLWLMRPGASYSIRLKKLRFYKKELVEFIRIGLPAGINGCLFSISNVLIQSNINSFGAVIMASSTAACNIEGFFNIAMNSFHQASLAFSAQNLAAHKKERLNKIIGSTAILYASFAVVLTSILLFARGTLLSFFTNDPEVIKYGFVRFKMVANFSFICAFQDIMCGLIRGYGSSVAATVISVSGICGFRMLWLYTAFRLHPTLEMLYLCYPLSWAIAGVIQVAWFLYIRRKRLREIEAVKEY